MAWQERIVTDPAIRGGEPVIRGTRVPVSLILGQLAAGATPEELAEEYRIGVEDVRAALEYAQQLVQGELVEEFLTE